MVAYWDDSTYWDDKERLRITTLDQLRIKRNWDIPEDE